ncbi:MAG: hypothetical protein ACKVOB_05705 [Sphingomonas sp.]
MTSALDAVAQAAPAIAMIAVFACVAGGLWQLSKGGDKRRGTLLLIMAAVLFGNVLVWTL